jgi:hypothetical protein
MGTPGQGGTAGPVLPWAARFETAVETRVARVLWRRGWRPRLLPFTGYGAAGPDGWVRLLGRVLLLPPGGSTGGGVPKTRRGWRHFLTVNLEGVEVVAEVGAARQVLRSSREGHLDAVVRTDLAAGWHDVRLSGPHVPATSARVHVVGRDRREAVVSDIDDTVMITALPRPLLAFWNSFVRSETSRQPVPGMAAFLHEVAAPAPDHDGDEEPFVVYVSTGAWNVAGPIGRFLHRHGYPPGPLLMTDWGPTETGFFRSGQEHKRLTLRRLTQDLPWLRWALVGDDGQHDPQLYDELVRTAPGHVRLVAVRRLSGTEQVLTHGTPFPIGDRPTDDEPAETVDDGVPRLRAADGHGLSRLLRGRTDAGG